MRKTLVALALLNLPLSTGALASEKPSLDTQWLQVQNIKPGSSIQVATTTAKQTCSFQSADSQTLSCSEKDKPNLTFNRSDIRTIVVAHRGRSALTGALLGGAIGAGIGAGTDFTHKAIYKAP